MSFLSKFIVDELLATCRVADDGSCVPYDNHPSVISLTVVVIFRVNAVHVVSVACQRGLNAPDETAYVTR